MAVDLHTAGEQREGGVVPDGTYVRLRMVINPGGISVPSPVGDPVQDQLDVGIFRQAKTIGLECEITVIAGPYSNHKIKEYPAIYECDESAANRSRATFRAMIDSACGLNPKDDSAQAQQTRTIRGYMDMSGVEFWGRVSVEPGGQDERGGNWPDKNRLDHVVVPGEPEYAALAAGQEVPPQPRNRAPRVSPSAAAVAAPAGVGRAWGAAAPAAAPAATPAPPVANKWATPTAANNQAAAPAQPAPPQAAPAPAPAATPMPTRWMQPKV